MPLAISGIFSKAKVFAKYFLVMATGSEYVSIGVLAKSYAALANLCYSKSACNVRLK